MRNTMKVCSVLFALVAVLALQRPTATAEQALRPADSGFSFDAYGDSRSMMYLPYKEDQEAEARKLMVDMFELVLPAHVAEGVVEKNVKLTYDPSNHELVQVVMPFMTASQVTTLRVDKGWVTEASVEDTKLLPGVSRTMFRLEGGDWVAREMVANVKSGRAKFLRWNVHPRLSDTVALVQATKAKTVIPAFCDRSQLSVLAKALASARVTMDGPIAL